MNSFVFPCSYVGSFVLKGCVADENVLDCAEIDEVFVALYYFEHHEQNFQCSCHWHVV